MSEPNMFSKHDMYTQIELLKKEVQDMKGIYQRLDTAIVKIGDVSNSINRMLAVHEEKISQQEDVLIRSDAEFSANVKELHSRITTNTKEMMALMSEQHKEQTDAMTKDRKSTRLNSSHGYISYAVFCLKKKKRHQRLASYPQ